MGKVHNKVSYLWTVFTCGYSTQNQSVVCVQASHKPCRTHLKNIMPIWPWHEGVWYYAFDFNLPRVNTLTSPNSTALASNLIWFSCNHWPRCGMRHNKAYGVKETSGHCRVLEECHTHAKHVVALNSFKEIGITCWWYMHWYDLSILLHVSWPQSCENRGNIPTWQGKFQCCWSNNG